MVIFLKKVILFITLTIILLFLLQKIIDSGLSKSAIIPYKTWNDIFNSRINADIIIMGSSRAYVHYSPLLIDSFTHLNSYNLGLDGWQFRMQYYRFLVYLKYNKPPKYVIQNVDHFTLTSNNYDFDPQFIPYLKYDLIKQAVSTCKGFSWKDFYIPLYKYHGNYNLITKGLISSMGFSYQQLSTEYKGHMEHNKTWDSSFNTFYSNNSEGWHIKLDSETKKLFVDYLNLCERLNIKVVFVYAPEYYKAQKLHLNRDSITNVFEKYSKDYNIILLDYSKDSICMDSINFYNSQHLNSIGVRKFNIKLLNNLKSLGYIK